MNAPVAIREARRDDLPPADAHRFYERLGFSATHVGMKLAIGRAVPR